ncbi:MAG: hypothetical protein OEM84_13710, partial [Acidimicrobiia bacterium]|nr:hypothetical protein [Acidimicrobiia bacterium]
FAATLGFFTGADFAATLGFFTGADFAATLGFFTGADFAATLGFFATGLFMDAALVLVVVFLVAIDPCVELDPQ